MNPPATEPHTQEPFPDLDPREYILIKGARANNLQNISLALPRYNLIVVTGLSGSGKSSLAFDTLYAEGQRMYVESLSSYARQFLGRMEKPDVDYIRGISPAIAIEQKVNTRNPRSTVGTTTEIYDYLKLLFARIGRTFSPLSGEEVKKDTVSDVVDYIENLPEGQRLQILAPLQKPENRSWQKTLQVLLQQGFTRLLVGSEPFFIENLLEEKDPTKQLKSGPVYLLIDRAANKPGDEENRYRLADSIQTAFFEGQGHLVVDVPKVEQRPFSDRFEADGMEFEEPSINFFSFNNSFGACKTCDGFGKTLGIDEEKVIPEKSLSVYEGAIVPWNSGLMRQEWLEPLLQNAMEFDFPVHRPIRDLSPEQYQLLWKGNQYFAGLNAFFHFLEKKNHKIQYRVMLSRYRGKTTCPDCRGTRLRKDASYVKVDGHSLTDLVLMPIDELLPLMEGLQLSSYEEEVARRILKEIRSRLHYLCEVGLGYLTLNRLTASLSGGEFQRIKLATSLGSALVGSMYILDEPSIGLHPRDTNRLVGVIQSLRNLGNTVIVVEHEEEVIRAADQLVDIGPDAGNNGGRLLFQGPVEEMLAQAEELPESHTARYLAGHEEIPLPEKRRPWSDYLEIIGARENNLRNFDVRIPMGVLTVITGVSGSGKSTLVSDIFFPALNKQFSKTQELTARFDGLRGAVEKVKAVEFVDQAPIGRSSRSNPVTYIKAYDPIRNLFAERPLAKQRGYQAKHFSFNVDGGRCDECKGEGEVKIEMQFMADIFLTCEACQGRRFKQEVLEVEYQGKTIHDVLQMTVDEAIDFFQGHKKITNALEPLQEAGLGYIGLGQSSNTLSGGEAQRVKLASFIGKGSNAARGMVFIFDEPTTGLHFHDINKLLKAMNRLVEQGNTVVIIEHNMEVIKSADWVIDLGPDGGVHGGAICFEGTPEALAQEAGNHTAQYLREKVSKG